VAKASPTRTEPTAIGSTTPAEVDTIASTRSSTNQLAVLDERAVPARVVALLSSDQNLQPASEVDHRPEDVERLKAAVMAGEIPWPIKYEPARKHLRINIKYVKAAAQQINNEGWTPGQDELLNA
jgi:hypothetical protein